MFLRFQTLPINVKQGPHCEKFPQNGVFDDFFTNWWKMPERAAPLQCYWSFSGGGAVYTPRLPSISICTTYSVFRATEARRVAHPVYYWICITLKLSVSAAIDIINNKARYNRIDAKYQQMAFWSAPTNPYLESLVKQNWSKFRGLCLHSTSVVILPNYSEIITNSHICNAGRLPIPFEMEFLFY